MSRGRLTEEVEALALKLLGQDITQEELRLMPYLMDCLLKGVRVEYTNLTQKEEDILELWQAAGWVIDPYHDLVVDSKFYDSLASILKLAYCKDRIEW